VLVEKQDRQATAEDTTHVRAADILAQRLPSVPDKPATDAKTTDTKAAEGTLEGTDKPAAPNAGSKPTGTTATSPGSKNLSDTGTVHSVPVAVQPRKATDLTPAVQKSAGASGGTTTASKSAASQAKLATTQPKAPQPSVTQPSATQPALPQATPPQSNHQPPADENSPN